MWWRTASAWPSAATTDGVVAAPEEYPCPRLLFSWLLFYRGVSAEAIPRSGCLMQVRLNPLCPAYGRPPGGETSPRC